MKIIRYVDNEYILHRPRVSYQISEYILEFIYTNILQAKRILNESKFSYIINLSFFNYDPLIHKYVPDNPYNTEDNKFNPEKAFSTVDLYIKQINVRLRSKYIDENLHPTHYADLVYDMFGALLTQLYKRIKKEQLDEFKHKLDYNLINSFAFPASFEEQKYMLDNNIVNGQNQRESYLNYWKM